jgi:hypothetical protein
MASSNVRSVSPDQEAAILAAFGSVCADALEAPDPAPPIGDRLTIADLRETLRQLVESAGSLYRTIVRMENPREPVPIISVNCDCLDAGAAAVAFAAAVRASADDEIRRRTETKWFAAKRAGGYLAAPVGPRMSDSQYAASQAFARRLGVDHQCDGPAVARDLQGHVQQAVLDMVCPREDRDLLDLADAVLDADDAIDLWNDEYVVSDPDEGPPDDDKAWTPSPQELAERIAAVRAGKVVRHA